MADLAGNSSGNTNVTIRSATSSEATTIAQLGARAAPLQYAGSPETPPEQYFRDMFIPRMISDQMNNEKKTMLVAEDQAQQIVGFTLLSRGDPSPCGPDPAGIQFWEDKKHVAIDMLYVEPSKHREGVRSELLEAAIKMAKDEGFELAWLAVLKINKPAEQLYKKKGFTTIGEFEEELVMAKIL
ncbi:acyl-CoA N-acyltransferase [Whalleya microplaca]|nr:acyl-CoA N-acyltransferase [Whalleya microplaca]